jgi:mRNA interferase MazF
MQRSEIYLARFPLGGTVGAKVRPALLLTGPVGPVPELLAVYISSVVPTPLLPSDLLLDPSLPEHSGANLKAVSVIRLHKLATIHLRDAFRRLGELSPATMQVVDTKLRALLNL